MLAILFVMTAPAALGVLLWVMAWRGWRKRVAMRRWPTASAVIRGHRTRLSGRSRMVDVEVRYSHQGHDYTVWCASPTGSGYGRGPEQPGRQMAAIYPAGSTHPVYVNPANAGEAFLVLPEPHMLAALACFGVIIVGYSTQLVLFMVTDIPEEVVRLLFMALVGVALTVLVPFLAAALFRAHRLRRRLPAGTAAPRLRGRPPRRRRTWGHGA